MNILEFQKKEVLKKNVISKKDDTKFLISIILIFAFVIWLFAPPGNKFLQIQYFLDNIKYQFENHSQNSKMNEYMHLRNNAIYIAKLYPKQPKRALYLIDKSIASVPDFMVENELPKLYKDRAYIKLFLGDKKGALADFLKSSNYDFNDNFTIAILLTDMKKYKLASKYCDNILQFDINAFYGYACLSYVYESAGYLQTAISLYDISIDRKPNNAKAYLERARLKQKTGDIDGYNADIKKAQEYSNFIDLNSSLIKDAIGTEELHLQIK